MSATIIPLINGALYGDPKGRRQQIVEEMADRLLEGDAWRDKADSLMSLMSTDRWSSFLIIRCVDEARQVAEQIGVVAKCMSEG